MAARKRLPSGRRPVLRWTPTAATTAGLERARASLTCTAQPIEADAALAQREQWRRDEQVQQVTLPLDADA